MLLDSAICEYCKQAASEDSTKADAMPVQQYAAFENTYLKIANEILGRTSQAATEYLGKLVAIFNHRFARLGLAKKALSLELF